jgi:hypothetical protein
VGAAQGCPADKDFIEFCRRHLQKLDNLLGIGWMR